MAAIPNVLPGEVIRAGLINQLIDAVNAGGGATVPSGVAVPDVFGMALAQARTAITQPAVNLTLGQVFDVFGTAINPNASVSAARLVLGQVPPANTRVPVGSPVSLTVAAIEGSGGGGGGQLPIGDLIVGGGIPPAGNINQNSTVEFIFPVTAAVTLEEKYDVNPVIVGASQPSQWQARVVTGPGPTPVSEITIPASPLPGVTVQVRVQVTVPNGTNGTDATLTLELTSQRNAALTDVSSPITFTVGSPAPPPETIGILFQNVANGNAQPDGTVQVLPPKSRLTYQATVPAPGSFDVTFDATPSGFNPSVFGGTSQSTISTQLLFRVDVSKTGSPGPGTLKIRVKDPNNPTTVFGTEDQKLA